MPPLRNQKHEKYALALFEGKPQNQAYVDAGYRYHEGNASRLRRNEQVIARLSELQSEAAANAEVTVASICKELDAANEVARQKGQAAAMVSAATLRAKLAGLMVERVEVGEPGAFDNLTSTAAIVDSYLEQVIEKFRPVDQKDREALLAMFKTFFAEVEEFIASLNARPIIAERIDARHLDRPWKEYPPYSPASRIGYRGNGGITK